MEREGSVSPVNNNFPSSCREFLDASRPVPPLLHAALLMAPPVSGLNPVSPHMLPLYNLVEICMRSDSDTKKDTP